MKQEATMAKLRDALFAKLATANVPLTAALSRQIDRRLRDLASAFRVPDHPPYASMICEAIEKLGEELGSREEDLSEFIVKGHENLPLAHELMLRIHLRKLSQEGEIVCIDDSGRYMLRSTAEKMKMRMKKKVRSDENQQEERECGGEGEGTGKETPTKKKKKKKKKKGRERNRTMQRFSAHSSEEAKSSNEALLSIQENAEQSEVIEELCLVEKQPSEAQECVMEEQCGDGENGNAEKVPLPKKKKKKKKGRERNRTMQRLNAQSSEEAQFSNEASMSIQENTEQSEVIKELCFVEKQPSEAEECVMEEQCGGGEIGKIGEDGNAEKEPLPKKRKGKGRNRTVQVLGVIDEENVQVTEQGQDVDVLEEGIEAQSRGIEVMTETREIQRPNIESSEEANSGDEVSVNIQTNAELSEVIEPQDQHVEVTRELLQLQDVQTKATSKQFEEHGQKTTLSEECKHQEHQAEVSEPTQVSPMEGDGHGDDMMDFLESNEDSSPMFQFQTPEMVRLPGLHDTWSQRTSCRDVSCVTQRDNLKQEVTKRLGSQCRSTLFGIEMKELMEEMTKMKKDLQEVTASEKQRVHVGEELLVLKKTYTEMLEKTKKVQKQLLEISLSVVEMEISKDDASKHALEKEKKCLDEEEQLAPQQQARIPCKERESIVDSIRGQRQPQGQSVEKKSSKEAQQPPKLCCAAEVNKSQVELEQMIHQCLQQSGRNFEPESMTVTSIEEISPPQQQTRDMQKQGRQLRPRGQTPSKPDVNVNAPTSLPANQNEHGKLKFRGRGRPPKLKLLVSTDPQLPKRGRGRPPKPSPNPDANTNTRLCQQTQNKGNEISPNNELLLSQDHQGHNEAHQQPEQATTANDASLSFHHNAPDQPPRGKGMPCKRKVDTSIETESTFASDTHHELQQPKRGRGRPPKLEELHSRVEETPPKAKGDSATTSEQPKGRGRPPNRIIHITDVSDDLSMPQTKMLLQRWGKCSENDRE